MSLFNFIKTLRNHAKASAQSDGYRRGKLVFRLDGERLKGRWALIRMGGKAGQDGKNWLLKKT